MFDQSQGRGSDYDREWLIDFRMSKETNRSSIFDHVGEGSRSKHQVSDAGASEEAGDKASDLEGNEAEAEAEEPANNT